VTQSSNLDFPIDEENKPAPTCLHVISPPFAFLSIWSWTGTKAHPPRTSATTPKKPCEPRYLNVADRPVAARQASATSTAAFKFTRAVRRLVTLDIGVRLCANPPFGDSLLAQIPHAFQGNSSSMNGSGCPALRGVFMWFLYEHWTKVQWRNSRLTHSLRMENPVHGGSRNPGR
jgi:hypothetical protein